MARGEAVLEKEGCGQVEEGEVSAGPEVVSEGLRYCGMSFPMACMGRWRYRLTVLTHALYLSLVIVLDRSWMSSCSHLLGGWLQHTYSAIVSLSETNTAIEAKTRLSNKHFHN